MIRKFIDSILNPPRVRNKKDSAIYAQPVSVGPVGPPRILRDLCRLRRLYTITEHTDETLAEIETYRLKVLAGGFTPPESVSDCDILVDILEKN